jgi:hypothetical protein
MVHRYIENIFGLFLYKPFLQRGFGPTEAKMFKWIILGFFFDKVRHITKKGFFALSDASRCGFEKNCSTYFAY